MRPDRARIVLSVPSKTFLVGEYAVLHGYPAVILAHGPRFQLIVEEDGVGACHGLHPQSPAGRYVRSQSEKFKKVSVSFQDIHEGRGGFGASSAQFVMAYAWSQLSQNQGVQLQNPIEPVSLWQAYRALHDNETQLPSGGDVMAQVLGKATTFQMTPWQAKSQSWPFSDLEVLLIPTGTKVATHEHLRERLPLSQELQNLAVQATEAFAKGQSAQFVTLFRAYGEELERLQLLTVTSRGLIAQVAAVPDVLAVKGCGALGADVLAVLVSADKMEVVRDRLTRQGLVTMATSQSLQSGLRLEVELAPQMKDQEIWV